MFQLLTKLHKMDGWKERFVAKQNRTKRNVDVMRSKCGTMEEEIAEMEAVSAWTNGRMDERKDGRAKGWKNG